MRLTAQLTEEQLKEAVWDYVQYKVTNTYAQELILGNVEYDTINDEQTAIVYFESVKEDRDDN